ncbi:hypothetical protein CCR75_006242 [Bremia lactucae]|uniref:Uncharacterized protein n=1 Tax=Bremia lactucae TaxID=4779 RepID=A0A976FGU4_BRELC|nr:hypothetical protein CCR75_006242 [Bremia lactucae]
MTPLYFLACDCAALRELYDLIADAFIRSRSLQAFATLRMLRAFINGASLRRSLLQQVHHRSQMPYAFASNNHVVIAKRSAVVVTQAKNVTSPRQNVKSLSYWKSAAFAATVYGAFNLLDNEHVAACASRKESDEDPPIEQLKKKALELSRRIVAELAALWPKDFYYVQERLDEFLDSGKGGQISWGFGMGACAGFALRKVSKLGAVAIGALFVLLQCASYSGYVHVDYQKMEHDVKKYLNRHKDETKDYDSIFTSLMEVLEFNLPAGSGFAIGWIVGFRADRLHSYDTKVLRAAPQPSESVVLHEAVNFEVALETKNSWFHLKSTSLVASSLLIDAFLHADPWQKTIPSRREHLLFVWTLFFRAIRHPLV